MTRIQSSSSSVHHHRQSSNKCSRLLLLGALMALLYGLFAILALSVIGRGSTATTSRSSGGRPSPGSRASSIIQANNNKGLGIGSKAGEGAGSNGHGISANIPKTYNNDHDVPLPPRGGGNQVSASSSLLRRPPTQRETESKTDQDELLPQDPAAPGRGVDQVGGGGGGGGGGGAGNKILGGRAIRRNFGGGGQVAFDSDAAAAAGGAEIDENSDVDGANDDDKEEGEEGAQDDDDDNIDDDDDDKPAADDDETDNDDRDDGRAEDAGGDENAIANNADAGMKFKRRNVVQPFQIHNAVDDDDERADNEEGIDDAKVVDVDAIHEEGSGGARAIFGRADAQNTKVDGLTPPMGQLRQAKGQVAGTKRTDRPVLKAYIEPIDQDDWKIKPLPARSTSSATLKVREYPEVDSCRLLPEQFPIDDPPTDEDPFLPWIHDLFPTSDGRYIQFVAQNRRRCQSGKDYGELKRFLQPNVALFQHVPVKRVESGVGETGAASQTRYRLSTHKEADPDAVATRFICRFSTGHETLSVFNFDYDYHTYRKRYKSTFTEEGYDNHMIWSSQLLFKCPVPEELIETVKAGTSVVDDKATLFVDLVPIRTPPRYGYPTQFLQPRYKGVPMVGADEEFEFDAEREWGKEHILPEIGSSGRWENLPICKPSLMTYVDNESDDENKGKNKGLTLSQEKEVGDTADNEEKRWKTIACTWTSASFFTRGERRHVTDNVRRLREWAEFHFLSGFDHIVIYDNSGAQEDGDATLEPVTSQFPGKITRINWPSKVCNNRPGTGDNKGERSSQYAAESSCRLRFGEHSEWLGSFDIDEYMVPMGDYTSMTDILLDMDKQGVKILSFQSMRAWPRMDLLENPEKFVNERCPEGCFHPKVQDDVTFMQTYNCDQEKPPRKNLMPAEKQIYRPDYVHLHFVHYSTVTSISQLSKKETEQAGIDWRRGYKELAVKIVDEEKEATMLHTKSVVWDQTKKWEKACKLNNPICKVGFPFPDGKDRSDGVVRNEDGYTCNCFVNKKIESVWVPKLEDALSTGIKFESQAQ